MYHHLSRSACLFLQGESFCLWSLNAEIFWPALFKIFFSFFYVCWFFLNLKAFSDISPELWLNITFVYLLPVLPKSFPSCPLVPQAHALNIMLARLCTYWVHVNEEWWDFQAGPFEFRFILCYSSLHWLPRLTCQSIDLNILSGEINLRLGIFTPLLVFFCCCCCSAFILSYWFAPCVPSLMGAKIGSG